MEFQNQQQHVEVGSPSDIHEDMQGVIKTGDSSGINGLPHVTEVEKDNSSSPEATYPSQHFGETGIGESTQSSSQALEAVAVEQSEKCEQIARTQLPPSEVNFQPTSSDPRLANGSLASTTRPESDGKGASMSYHAVEISSLLNPQTEDFEPPILSPDSTHSGLPQPDNNNAFLAPEQIPLSDFIEEARLSLQNGQPGTNSPLSAESTNSNTTDTAYQFYNAHHGYQGQETAAAFPENEEVSAVSEPPAPEPVEPPSQPSGIYSDAEPRAEVTLPDDGYYPTSLHVDSEVSDTDSAIGSDVQSSTMSLRSSLYESMIENGRSYHKYKEGQYYLPNDDIEQDRLNLQHHLWTLTLDGRLHLAPVEEPQRVLDIGTGTGLWALEYAERYPSAMVIGTDLSAIQPEYVPPNCQFEIDDAEDEWTYNTKFDFIHGRMLFTCFQNPAAVFKRAYDALAPGGYFEMQDVSLAFETIDGSGDNTPIQAWNAKIIDGAARIGRDWHCTLKYAKFMRDAGFEGVTERHFKWPSNTWPKGKKQKLLGMWSMANFLDGLPSVSMAIMTRAHGMTREEVEIGMVDVRKDIKDKSIHGYVPVYVVYGRKPFAEENVATW